MHNDSAQSGDDQAGATPVHVQRDDEGDPTRRRSRSVGKQRGRALHGDILPVADAGGQAVGGTTAVIGRADVAIAGNEMLMAADRSLRAADDGGTDLRMGSDAPRDFTLD